MHDLLRKARLRKTDANEEKDEADQTQRRGQRAVNDPDFVRIERGVRRPSTQADWGVGIGMTSFRIANSAITDVRLRVDDNSVFNNLPTAAKLTSDGSNSYSTVFGVLYATFKISDEFEVGLDIRSYRDDTVNSAQVKVDKLGFNVGVVWYPTFAFKKKGT